MCFMDYNEQLSVRCTTHLSAQLAQSEMSQSMPSACQHDTAGIRKFRILEKWLGSRNTWYSDLTAFDLNFRRARRLTHKWVSNQQEMVCVGQLLEQAIWKDVEWLFTS